MTGGRRQTWFLGGAISVLLHVAGTAVFLTVPLAGFDASLPLAMEFPVHAIVLEPEPAPAPAPEPRAAAPKPEQQPTPADAPKPDPAVAAKPAAPEVPPPPSVRLGVDDGKKDTPTWLGSKLPGEHQGPLSTTDQPALARNPGPGGPPAPSASPSPASTPSPTSAQTPQPRPDKPADKPQDTPDARLDDHSTASPSGAPLMPNAKPSREPSAKPAESPASKPVSPTPPSPTAIDTEPRPAVDLPIGPKSPDTKPAVNPPVEPAKPGAADHHPQPDGIGGSAVAPDTHRVESTPAPTAPPKSISPAPPPSPASPRSVATPDPATGAPAQSDPLRTPGQPQFATRMLLTPMGVIPMVVAAPPPSPASRPSSGTMAGGGDPNDRGAPSDRQADAASTIRRIAEYRNGRVDAGEGIEIRTVRPQFSLVARSLAVPSSPVVEIVFGRDGVPKHVRIVKSSGYSRDVDDPVVSAMYQWRASGKALTEQTRADPGEVRIEIIVRLGAG